MLRLWTLRVAGLVLCVAVAILLASCGGGTSSSPSASPAPGAASTAPTHVFLIVEENHGFSSVIGNPAMPYLNGLASANSLATEYFADIHPSLGNYFMLTTGQVITFNDSFTGTVSADNLVRDILAKGKTWKAYVESLPSDGYTGPDVFPYVRRHNPFAYFSDVQQSSAQQQNMVPFSQFSADLASANLPDFSFIVPDVLHDAHTCPGNAPLCPDTDLLAPADQWLQTNISPLIASPVFQQSGLLIIVFDEAEITDFSHGGGHVAMVLVGPSVKKNYKSTTFYQHQSTLRLIEEKLGLSALPGASADAPDMGEFF